MIESLKSFFTINFFYIFLFILYIKTCPKIHQVNIMKNKKKGKKYRKTFKKSLRCFWSRKKRSKSIIASDIKVEKQKQKQKYFKTD